MHSHVFKVPSRFFQIQDFRNPWQVLRHGWVFQNVLNLDNAEI